jgi:hypothetical protein
MRKQRVLSGRNCSREFRHQAPHEPSHQSSGQCSEGNLYQGPSNSRPPPASHPAPSAWRAGNNRHNIYNGRLAGFGVLPTTLRWNTSGCQSTPPHTIHEFSKASGNLLRGSQKRTDGKPLALELPARPRNEFPPAIPQRVALQQSPLALGRPHHIVNPNRCALPINKLPTGCPTALHRSPPHQQGARKNHWCQHTTTGTMKSKPGQNFPP